MQENAWLRGDWVVRGSESGFVTADMRDVDEFLTVRWQSGIERIHRSKLGGIRKPTEVEKAKVSKAGHSPLESLEALEALDSIERMSAERSSTIRNPREQRIVDELIRRGYSETPECDWDRRNADMLVLLALQPDKVGWLFKCRERVHRPIHALFHRHST